MPIRKQPYRPVEPGERDRILDAWAAGVSLPDLARDTGRTEGSIATVLYVARLAGDPRAAYRLRTRRVIAAERRAACA